MFRKYPSVFLLTGVVAGVLIADTTRLPVWVFLLSCVGCGLFAIYALAARKAVWLAWLALGTFLFFAALRFGLAYYDLSPDYVSHYADGHQSYRLYGSVSDWPDLKPELTEIKLELDSLVGDRAIAIRGNVLLKLTDTTTAIQRGDRIECMGRIYPVTERTSSGGFDYQRYLKLKGISGVVYLPTLLDIRIDRRNHYSFFAFIAWLREAIRASLYRNLSPESAALASGLLIGETREIPIAVYQKFRDSGTLHLLAVSGSNVALIVVFFIAILRPFKIRRKLRAIALLLIVVLFSFLSYGEPSVLRASLMAGLVLGAGMLERRYDLNNIIALAALIILLVDPGQLYDVGFQLSFVIAWGLIFVLPRLVGLFASYHSKPWYRFLVFPLLVSLVAQLCATGLIGLYFQRIPLLSPLANLIVVPMVSLAVIGILALLLANLVLPIFGIFVGTWLEVLISAVIRVVGIFGAESAPALRFDQVSAAYVVAGYLLIAIAAAAVTNRRFRRLAVIALILMINTIFFRQVVAGFTGQPKTLLTCFTLPGGVAATVVSDRERRADLVIVNSKQTKYRLDEKVLLPQLRADRIDKINRLFVLSGEYGALDDLIRLARTCSVDTLYTAPALMSSLREIIADNPEIESTLQIVAFSDLPADTISAGYFTTSEALILRTANDLVLFANHHDIAIPATWSSTDSRILVLGRTVEIGSDDRMSFEKRGITEIVCARIEQLEPRAEDSPIRVHQLATEGSLKLSLR